MKKLILRLAGMPVALPNEAPSSWLTRAALAQAAPLKELLRYLQLGDAPDPDVRFAVRAYEAEIEDEIDDGRLAAPIRLLNAAVGLENWGLPQLLRDKRGRSRCRYCPLCLASQPRPYFQVHTRFASCHICPTHDCWMEDCCRACGAWVLVPTCLLTASQGAMDRPFLTHCEECGASLRACRATEIPRAAGSPLEPWQWRQLDLARTELCSIYQGKKRQPSWRGSQIDGFRLLSRAGLLHLEGANSRMARSVRAKDE